MLQSVKAVKKIFKDGSIKEIESVKKRDDRMFMRSSS